tara:strand:- start:327 stop:770 length:444 start_codon:yes stop_codon:yes gene_type:complete
MQNGQLFEQAILCKPVTTEIDGSWLPINKPLPTPTTMDHLPPRSKEGIKRQMQGSRKGRTQLATLREAVNPESVKIFNSLLPTPRASEWKGVGQVGSKSSLKMKKQGYLSGVINEDCSPQTGEATHLNPAFVEEMMGFEIGHTDLRL